MKRSLSPTTLLHGLLLAGLLTGLLNSGAARAAPDVAALRSATLAAACANCHGTNGHAIEGSVVPGLAGQTAAYLSDQMQGFKNGSRPATVMHQIARGYSDAQISTLAAYFAAQKR